MRADLKGNYRFALKGQGIATLAINGATIFTDHHLSAAGDTSPDVQLEKGYNRIRLGYSSPPDGDATLRLLWSCAQFEPELLPATALYHDGTDPELLAARQARDGRDLFAAHRCAKCHATPGNLTAGSMPELASDAPSLTGIGSRLRSEWIQSWLLDPKSIGEGATMPRLLHDRPGLPIRQQAADVAAYLATLGRPAAETTPKSGDERLAEGEALYEDLGCIQCHRFTSPGDADPFGRTSLSFVGEKFQPGALQAYLAHPHAHYAWSRMPDFHLSASETAALAEFISGSAMGKVPTAEGLSPDVARGRELFQGSGCRQCHRLDEATAPSPPTRASDWPSGTARGCLADDPAPLVKLPISVSATKTANHCVRSCVGASPTCSAIRRPRCRSG